MPAPHCYAAYLGHAPNADSCREVQLCSSPTARQQRRDKLCTLMQDFVTRGLIMWAHLSPSILLKSLTMAMPKPAREYKIVRMTTSVVRCPKSACMWRRNVSSTAILACAQPFGCFGVFIVTAITKRNFTYIGQPPWLTTFLQGFTCSQSSRFAKCT